MRAAAGFWPDVDDPQAGPGDGRWYVAFLPDDDELSSAVREPSEAEVRAAVEAINGRGALLRETSHQGGLIEKLQRALILQRDTLGAALVRFMGSHGGVVACRCELCVAAQEAMR